MSTESEELRKIAGTKVLVVEDEMLIAIEIKSVLKKFGCTVVGPASNVAKALKLLENEDVDAAFLDVNLDGELIIPVAQVLAAKGKPFIFLTGYQTPPLPDEYLSIPIIQKPFVPKTLLQALSETLLLANSPA